MGQRVLLIDADLRKPLMHTRLGLNNQVDYLIYSLKMVNNGEILYKNVPGYNNWNVMLQVQSPRSTRLLAQNE